MSRFITIQKLFFVLILTVTIAVIPLGRVHALASTINVSLDWADSGTSCSGTANGQTVAYYGAVGGNSATLHITNASSTYSITVDVSEAGQSPYSTTLLPGASVSPVFPVNSEITIQGNGTVCTSGHGGPGTMFVEAASGSMSCTIQNNQVWQVSLNFTNIINTATLYRDSNLVDTFSNVKGNALNFPVAFSAQSTAATYYLYYSSGGSNRLLGQATCPAKVAPAAAPSTSTSTHPPITTSTPQPPQATSSQPTDTSPPPSTKSKTGASKIINIQPTTIKKPHKTSPWLSLLALPVALLAFAVWKSGILLKIKSFKNK